MGGEEKMSSRGITIKCNTRTLTRQLNKLFESNKLSSNPEEVKEFLKENIDVCTLVSSEDVRVYLELKKGIFIKEF